MLIYTHPAPTKKYRAYADLRAGDIILWSANYTSVVRCIEKTFLQSPFTHISLVVYAAGTAPFTNDVVVVESVRTGIRLVPLQEALGTAHINVNAHNQQETIMTRALLPPLSPKQCKTLHTLSHRFCGGAYAFTAWKAIMYMWTPHLCLPLPSHNHSPQAHSKRTGNPLFWTQARYCSELIAVIYELLGIYHPTQPVDTLLPHHFSITMHDSFAPQLVAPYCLGVEMGVCR